MKVCLEVDVEGTQHFAARRLLQCAKRLRPGRRALHSFPSFSGSHGWQWWREIYLNDASVWTYDLASNTWRNMRPLPAPHVAPLRCASWDSEEQVVVVFGGEGGPRETLTYNPHRNEWRWMKPKLQPEPRSGGQMAYD